MGGGNANGGTRDAVSGGGGAKPLSQEPTTNAHDWVWLGRSTLERSSGMLVPSMGNKSHNNNGRVNEQNMRIMSNPIYGVDNGCGTGNNQQQQQQQRACVKNPSPQHINTSTYSVKDRLSNGNVVFNKLWKV